MPEQAGEGEFVGLTPARGGHEGFNGKGGGELFTEFEAGVDADAADEFNTGDLAGEGGVVVEAQETCNVVGVPVDPDDGDAGAGA